MANCGRISLVVLLVALVTTSVVLSALYIRPETIQASLTYLRVPISTSADQSKGNHIKAPKTCTPEPRAFVKALNLPKTDDVDAPLSFKQQSSDGDLIILRLCQHSDPFVQAAMSAVSSGSGRKLREADVTAKDLFDVLRGAQAVNGWLDAASIPSLPGGEGLNAAGQTEDVFSQLSEKLKSVFYATHSRTMLLRLKDVNDVKPTVASLKALQATAEGACVELVEQDKVAIFASGWGRAVTDQWSGSGAAVDPTVSGGGWTGQAAGSSSGYQYDASADTASTPYQYARSADYPHGASSKYDTSAVDQWDASGSDSVPDDDPFGTTSDVREPTMSDWSESALPRASASHWPESASGHTQHAGGEYSYSSSVANSEPVMVHATAHETEDPSTIRPTQQSPDAAGGTTGPNPAGTTGPKVDNFEVKAVDKPNDKLFNMQWGHEYIDVLKAWALTRGDKDITVAVLDTGVDLQHPDLKAHLKVNEAELRGVDGQDDDKNGYVDDVIGYNFLDGTNDVMDNNAHGTHCAGVIAAIAGDGAGTAGVAAVKVLPVKVLGKDGSGSYSGFIQALEYVLQLAAKGEVHVVSNSYGGDDSDPMLKEELRKVEKAGLLMVYAAGNENEPSASFPAAHNFKNMVNVAASNTDNCITTFSNYNKENVHIAAPGQHIISTVPTEFVYKHKGQEARSYAFMDGTSMATPYVAGVSALVVSALKQQGKQYIGQAEFVKKILQDSVDKSDNFKEYTAWGGTVNAFRAVKLAFERTPPKL